MLTRLGHGNHYKAECVALYNQNLFELIAFER